VYLGDSSIWHIKSYFNILLDIDFHQGVTKMVRKQKMDPILQEHLEMMQQRKGGKEKKKEKQESKKEERQQKYYENRRVKMRLKRFISCKGAVTPHPLIIVNREQFNEMKKNSIVLKNMERVNVNKKNSADGGMTNYSIAYCGNNISYLLVQSWLNKSVIDVKLISDGYLVILCSAKEMCLAEDEKICFTTQQVKQDDYVLLLLCIGDIRTFAKVEELMVWDNVHDLIPIRQCKKSTIKNHSHHHYGSSGYCYSFGVRDSYSKDVSGMVSIGNYRGDDSLQMQKYKDYILRNFSNLHKAFDTVIPGLPSRLNLTCRFYKSLSKKNSKLESYFNTDVYKVEDMGILSGSVNIDAKTSQLHCECDCTYTSIYIPNQADNSATVTFEFNIGQNNTIRLRFPQWSGFTYSAYCLGHRQVGTEGLLCMNLSTYSGKRMFYKYRQSYI
jgi:hypothetical protein